MDELYEQRILVFLEEEPQSNKYRHVALTPEEFKNVSLSFGNVVSEDEEGLQKVDLRLSEEVFDLPDLPSYI